MNLLCAVVSLVILIIVKHAGGAELIDTAAAIVYHVSDGIDLTRLPALFPLALLLYFGILTNVALFLFNLIPIPPLDGSRILTHFLPYKAQQMYDSIGGWGMLLLYVIVARLHVLNAIYEPVLGLFNWMLFRL